MNNLYKAGQWATPEAANLVLYLKFNRFQIFQCSEMQKII